MNMPGMGDLTGKVSWFAHSEPPRHVDYGTMRERLVPMIAMALMRTSKIGLDIIAWDYMCVPMPNAVLTGVAIAIRGYDLTGPGKELMQFRAFSTWAPTQEEVDKVVTATIDGLREAKDKQHVNGQQ